MFVGAVVTFFVYMIAVSYFICLLDDMSFMDAIYFVFTSVALIGSCPPPDEPSGSNGSSIELSLVILTISTIWFNFKRFNH